MLHIALGLSQHNYNNTIILDQNLFHRITIRFIS